MAINLADFVAGIDNPFFPLKPGTTYVYQSPDGSLLRTFEITHETIDILGVTCIVVHDTSREDGVVTEFTKDYFAQDKYGNVWYFGEDTQEFPSGSMAGTWRADVDGAEPGFIMLASFREPVGGAGQWVGPFERCEDASAQWGRRAWATVDDGHARWRIEQRAGDSHSDSPPRLEAIAISERWAW